MYDFTVWHLPVKLSIDSPEPLRLPLPQVFVLSDLVACVAHQGKAKELAPREVLGD